MELREHARDRAEGYTQERTAARLRRHAQDTERARINAGLLTYFISALNNLTHRHYAGDDGQRVGVSGEGSLERDEKPV